MRWIAIGARNPAGKFGAPVRACRLVPDHVHLAPTPSDAAGLALARAHRLYAAYFNAGARSPRCGETRAPEPGGAAGCAMRAVTGTAHRNPGRRRSLPGDVGPEHFTTIRRALMRRP